MVKKNKQHGFSLLEVMIAISILAVSLMTLLKFHSTAVMTSGRAQFLSIATLLARHQMSQLILVLEEENAKGGVSDERSEQGDFSEIGFPDYRWEMDVRKAEIPAPPLPEEGGELIGKIIENITKQISESTREMTLTVLWDEMEEEQSIAVTTHLVNLQTAGFRMRGGR